MTRAEICTAPGRFLKVMADTPQGDAVADLLALAWPDNPPAPLMGFGDSFDRIKPALDALLKGWDHIGRFNEPIGATYREAARAVRFLMRQIEGEA